MSQPPSYPSDNPDPAPPIPAIPAIPIPDYMAAGAPSLYRKPGWLTTLTVLGFIISIGSIVVALIAGLAGIAAHQSQQFSRTSSVILTAPTNMMPAPFKMPRGYTLTQSQAAQMALTAQKQLSVPRLEQLDAIITDHGESVTGLPGAQVSVDAVQARIQRISQLPTRSGPAIDVFELTTGRLELTDTNAVFHPEAGPSVRSGGQARDPSGQLKLNEDQVRAVVDRLREMAGAAMTDAHARGLSTQLRQGGQQIVHPAVSITAVVSQLGTSTGLSINEDGVLSLNSVSGTPIEVDSTGQVVVGVSKAAALGAASRAQRAATRRMIFYGLENFATATAGVFLLVATIVAMRQSRHGPRMLRIYAAAKIVLALTAAWIWGTFWGAIAEDHAFLWPVAIIVAVLGIAFPAALLITLRTRAARDYYQALG